MIDKLREAAKRAAAKAAVKAVVEAVAQYQARVYDVVQIDPSVDEFGACFGVVSEVRKNGRLMVYVQSAGLAGQAYVFLNQDQYKLCGVAVWVPEGEKK